MAFETPKVHAEGAVLSVEITAPPMNFLGPELVRDLVSLIQRAEADDVVRVLVLRSGDPDYFISHVDVTRIQSYREEAAKLTGEPSLGAFVGSLAHRIAAHSAWEQPAAVVADMRTGFKSLRT